MASITKAPVVRPVARKPLRPKPTKTGFKRRAKTTAGTNRSAATLKLTNRRIGCWQCGQFLFFPKRFISRENRPTDSLQCGHFMSSPFLCITVFQADTAVLGDRLHQPIAQSAAATWHLIRVSDFPGRTPGVLTRSSHIVDPSPPSSRAASRFFDGYLRLLLDQHAIPEHQRRWYVGIMSGMLRRSLRPKMYARSTSARSRLDAANP